MFTATAIAFGISAAWFGAYDSLRKPRLRRCHALNKEIGSTLFKAAQTIADFETTLVLAGKQSAVETDPQDVRDLVERTKESIDEQHELRSWRYKIASLACVTAAGLVTMIGALAS